MDNISIKNIIIALTSYLSRNNKKITSAESCTGGLLANYLTSISGSSKWFEYGFITYSNEAKFNILNVPWDILNTYGPVSEKVALYMAQGALNKSNAHFAISISGIAGPGTDEFKTPVGTVIFSIADKILNKSTTSRIIIHGNREQIRSKSVKLALQFMLHYLNSIFTI